MEVNVDQEMLASNKTAQRIGVVEGLSGLADISGVVMDRGLVVIEDGRVPVNLINVHNHSIVLHKGKTLGEWQPVKSVVKMVSSEKKYNRAVQPDRLDFPDGFMAPGAKRGETDVTEHGMDMQNNAPVKQRWTPWPRAKMEAADELVLQMLDDDVIEPW